MFRVKTGQQAELRIELKRACLAMRVLLRARAKIRPFKRHSVNTSFAHTTHTGCTLCVHINIRTLTTARALALPLCAYVYCACGILNMQSLYSTCPVRYPHSPSARQNPPTP